MEVLIRTISLRAEEGGGALTVPSMCQALGERVRDPVCNQAQGRLPGLSVYTLLSGWVRLSPLDGGVAGRCILSITRHAIRVSGGKCNQSPSPILWNAHVWQDKFAATLIKSSPSFAADTTSYRAGTDRALCHVVKFQNMPGMSLQECGKGPWTETRLLPGKPAEGACRTGTYCLPDPGAGVDPPTIPFLPSNSVDLDLGGHVFRQRPDFQNMKNLLFPEPRNSTWDPLPVIQPFWA